MEHTISIAPDVIRARVQALTALHLFMRETSREPLTEDNAPALNQLIAGAFTATLLRNAPHVKDFVISPTNFYREPTELLMLEVTFAVPDGAEFNSSIAARALEELIAYSVMTEIIEDRSLAEMYRQRAADEQSRLDELFTVAGFNCRLRRSLLDIR